MAYMCSFQIGIFKPEGKITQTGFQTLVISMASPIFLSPSCHPSLLSVVVYLHFFFCFYVWVDSAVLPGAP